MPPDARGADGCDPAGRAKYFTDPAGNVSTVGYDALDRVTRTQDVLDAASAFVYDANGNLTRMTDPRGGVTQYGYDLRDRLSTRTDPLGRIERFSYDPAGNLTQHVDRKGQANTFIYDALGRRTTAAYGSADASTYTYDAGDRLTAVATTQGATTENLTRKFDLLDRLTSSATPAGTVSYAYDAAGRMTTMTATGQPNTAYAYDAADQLTSIVRAGTTVALTYDAAGRRLTTSLPNGARTAYVYDASGRTTRIDHTVAGVSVGRFAYAYDGSGRRSRTDTTMAPTALPAAVSTATYDAANRLTNWGANTLSYDANGNLTSDGTTTYGWNNRRQLASVTRASATTRYRYDALGRRSERTTTSTTRYLYDRLNQIQTINGTARTQLLAGAAVDEYFARVDTTGAQAFLTDDLGSTVGLVGPTGALTTRYAYEPFGRTTATGTGTGTAFQYTGRENEGDGLYYLRARYLSTQYHRFLSEDPFEFNDGPNLYAYVGSAPLDATDPLGLTGWRLPQNPGGLPDTWQYDPGHRDPNGARYRHPNGDVLDFHEGRPGEPGWRGKDHWHHQDKDGKTTPGKDGDHLVPGESEIPDPEPAPPAGESGTAKSVAIAAGATIGTVGLGYLIYRCVRFVPSLAPPLWWTIPANVAIP